MSGPGHRPPLVVMRQVIADLVKHRADVAKLLGVSPRTVFNWVRDRGLPVQKLSDRRWVFVAEDVEKWKAGQTTSK